MRNHISWLTPLSLCALLPFAHADIIPGDKNDLTPIAKSVIYMNQPILQVGGFGEGANQLGGADTVELDKYGNIYVVDDIQRLIKVWEYDSPDGDVLEIIGSDDLVSAGLAPLGDIQAIAIDRHGKDHDALYVLDRDKDRDPEFRILRRSALQPYQWSQLAFTDFEKTPNDLIIDKHGSIIVVEKKGRIEVLLPDGSGHDTGFADNGILKVDDFDGIDTDDFKAVDLDKSGNIYVSDKDVGRILKISPDGEVLQSFGSQGPGADQFLEQVEGLAVDWKGNVYGRDESGDRVLAFDPDGDFLTSVGERGFDPHQQENADEFTIDWSHKRFVWADNNNYRVSSHKMHKGQFMSGIFTEYDFPDAPVVQPAWIAGGTQGGAPGSEFDEPNELGFDANGNLWAGDVFNYRVQIFDSSGVFLDTVGGEGNGACQFANPGSGKFGPEAIRVDSTNQMFVQMFVVDRGGQKINVYDADDFSCLGEINSPLFDDPTGLAIDSAGDLYVADQGTDLIHQFTNGGVFVRTFQADDGGESILAKTETLALDEGRDRLYASSEDESRVEVFELSTGDYLDEHVGERQVGVIAQDGRFADDVEGVATDLGDDWLLMSDEDNGRFMIHDLGSGDLFDGDADYAFLGAFGRIGNASGEFLSADGVTVSESLGLVAIADQGNYRIQAFRIEDIMAVLGL